MRRRAFLSGAGSAGALALAGCLTQGGGGGEPSGTLTVATYESFVDSPSSSPGAWIKENFESEYDDVTVEYVTPENGVTNYVQRKQQGAPVEADVYVGLNVDDLVTIDATLGDDTRLFRELDRDFVANAEHLRPELEFGDPKSRVLPYDTGYISLVYDEDAVDEPATFDDLTSPAYEGTLLAQNAQSADSGQAFLLWTINEFGTDGYLDYWRDLQANDVRILGSWWDAYSAYLESERPMVVSYSTDQVFANEDDLPMNRHQIGFLEDQGYANPEGMAVVEDSGNVDLATDFFDFMLRGETQTEIAVRNVQFPAVTEDQVDLDDSFAQYAHRPPEAVSFDYEALEGNLSGWVDEWARTIASN
ncbi:thiamine ABC transporter substrate binding subunit [Haloarchaeobius sp. FL176]|uniref:thiamine ABC transporter substrate-binding protein n=1 Tax=Haloarchaeobius sp. FL176 TaxID=2967129 RepID=UPI0021494E24|nr:thiamine ABC transporter substrate-binding protein [Haloarchaeobius sp. FL176]